MSGEEEEDEIERGDREDSPPPVDAHARLEITPEEFEKALREKEEYLEIARRARADYQNLKRHMEAQGQAIRAEAEQRFALDMIAVLDDLERAIEHVRTTDSVRAVVKGITLVRENFLAALAHYGITPVEAKGERFDHNLHHAIAEQPTEDVPAGTVVAVAQTGYLADGKLLRPAQVVVARPFDNSEGKETREEETEE